MNTLKVLRQLDTQIKSKVHDQILENEDFQEAIYKYITNTKPEEVSHDAFVFYTELDSEGNFKEHKTESSELSKSLFDALDHVREEKVYNSIVTTLISNSSTNEQTFLDLCSTHKNARYFGEYLLQMFNKSEEQDAAKCIQCIKLLLESSISEGFFYINDLRELSNIVIQNLENIPERHELKAKYFDLLKSIVKIEGFKEMNHRLEEIKTFSESYLNSENNELKDNAQVIIELLRNEDSIR